MSLKNRDEHNRWRNKTVAFRVSPEEDAQIERYVQLSGLTKQDYITRRLISSVGCSVGMWWFRAIRESIRHCEISWLLCWTSCAGSKLGKA